ncbi:hypothetical protein PQO03_02985 [Lentisphaera profundi]|uniref:Pectate lyase superfamily protein domain-containing protein n=1 Tax=Lentisphaera profundi TaxID=1658616 RepID=A0ABY7VW13_9BACT|nr:hypothetical protein [Lentisphaera profundi]WDE96924.1 hypothetical protein PQO03_02985 [Lentisphaera profundi]
MIMKWVCIMGVCFLRFIYDIVCQKSRNRSIFLLTILCAFNVFSETNESSLLRFGPTGKLLYKAFNEQGGIIPDFSVCGYRGGGVKLPRIENKLFLEAGDGVTDDTSRIQEAIDKLARMVADNQGFRGALLLKKGVYLISDSLEIRQSGIVIRGEGQGPEGTVLYASADKVYNVIELTGRDKLRPKKNHRVKVLNDYVPIGVNRLCVSNTKNFAVGETILLTRMASQAWLRFIGMWDLQNFYNNKNLSNWEPKDYNFQYERKIIAIDGNNLIMNAAVVEPLNKSFGEAYISKTLDRRLELCGVEDLRIVSHFDHEKQVLNDSKEFNKNELILSYKDENHARIGVYLNRVSNSWVRNVTALYLAQSAVHVNQSSYITVQDCAMIDPVSSTQGGRKYAFVNEGQLNLFQRLYSRNARHDYTLGPRIGGPNVFLHCYSDNSLNASESHHRYGHGALFDSCVLRGEGLLLALNRGQSGTGHGWSGAMIIFWNCAASLTAIMSPPSSQNFSIGWTGNQAITQKTARQVKILNKWLEREVGVSLESTGDSVLGDGYIESSKHAVEPYSLYLQQLEERLGKQALINISHPWQLSSVNADYIMPISKEKTIKKPIGFKPKSVN